MITRSDYERIVGWVGGALARATDRTVFYCDATTIAAYCPRCRRGTLRVEFHDTGAFDITSNGIPGCCSRGCSEEKFLAALRATITPAEVAR